MCGERDGGRATQGRVTSTEYEPPAPENPSTTSAWMPAPAPTAAESVDCGTHEAVALSLLPSEATPLPCTTLSTVFHVARLHVEAERVPAAVSGHVGHQKACSGPEPPHVTLV